MDIYLETDEIQVCVLTCIKDIYRNLLPPKHSEVARIKYIRIEADGAINTNDVLMIIGLVIAIIICYCCGMFTGARFCKRRNRDDDL